jgi:hypothetical protein
MKKIIVTLVIAVSSFSAAFAGNSFGKPTAAEGEEVNNDQHVSAYYNMDGELMGLTRYISPADLPLALQSDLKKNHCDYWISDLFEVANESGTAYYITLEDADTSIVLKATDGKSWKNYKKVKKA